MDRITDFIRNFDSSLFGVGSWDMWIALAIMVLIYTVLSWLTSFIQPTRGQRIKKVLAIVFNSLFIGILFFVLLNSLLTERYDRLMIFILILFFLKRLVGNFYKRYDELVDRLANR
jgi:hypothetical protein